MKLGASICLKKIGHYFHHDYLRVHILYQSIFINIFHYYFCQTPVLGLGLGVDFTFAWDNHNNENHNNNRNHNNPHLNFVKGTVLGDREQ